MSHVQTSTLVLVLVLLFLLFLIIAINLKSKKPSTKSPEFHSRQEPEISGDRIKPPAIISEDRKKPPIITPEARKNNPIIMSAKHKRYRDKSYNLLCSDEVFNENEIEILTEYGSWLSALASEKIEPETDSQREFVKLCKDNQDLPLSEMIKNLKTINPETSKIQFVWFKYLCRKQAEKEDPEFIKDRRQEVSVKNKALKISHIRELERQIEFQTQIQIQKKDSNNEQSKALIEILKRKLAHLKASK